jgi:hypothetical protein
MDWREAWRAEASREVDWREASREVILTARAWADSLAPMQL